MQYRFAYFVRSSQLIYLYLPGWSDEEHEEGAEVGPRLLRPLDPRGLHRLRREDGAHHQNIQHSRK